MGTFVTRMRFVRTMCVRLERIGSEEDMEGDFISRDNETGFFYKKLLVGTAGTVCLSDAPVS